MRAASVTFLRREDDQIRSRPNSEKHTYKLSLPTRKASLRNQKGMRDQYQKGWRGSSAAIRAWFRRRAGRGDWEEDCAFGI